MSSTSRLHRRTATEIDESPKPEVTTLQTNLLQWSMRSNTWVKFEGKQKKNLL